MLSLSYHALGACFNPYKALFNLYTKFFPFSKPISYIIYISILILEYIKAFLILYYNILYFKVTTSNSNILKILGLAIAEKVSR